MLVNFLTNGPFHSDCMANFCKHVGSRGLKNAFFKKCASSPWKEGVLYSCYELKAVTQFICFTVDFTEKKLHTFCIVVHSYAEAMRIMNVKVMK